jgi:PIN domain nuclease of toxin-antitoxin system
MIYLDTHVVVWLFSGHTELLSQRGERAIEENDLLICPIVSLELQYLFEIDKILRPAHVIIGELSKSLGLSLSRQPFEAIIAEANRLSWTRDPFDRIITAHASLQKAPLLTKDTTISSHYKKAFW